MKKLTYLTATVMAWAATSSSASAAALNANPPDISNPLKGNADFGHVITVVINFLLAFAGAIAVLFLIIGGFRYVISSGSPDQVEAAKKTILYAILGLIIIFIAFVIVQVILTQVLNVDTPGSYLNGH